MAMKYANIPEATVKNTAHDDDDRLEAVRGGAELSAAPGPSFLVLGEALPVLKCL